jgi:hypothetical protein
MALLRSHGLLQGRECVSLEQIPALKKSSDPRNEGEAISTGISAAAAAAPFVFISHDSRDAELAEAFSKLLKSVSAGMIKTFRSSDKKGTEGFDFGEEWYRTLMQHLDSTSDVVCLFTERSLGRPWILFEAGVAKGRLNKPVIGVALGIPLNRVTAGPFYQFQNMDDSPDQLTKLVTQLAGRIPDLELDEDVVETQIQAFKKTEAEILRNFSKSAATKPDEKPEETSIAKLVEEMKALPTRVAERISEGPEFLRQRRPRRLHPMMVEELMHMSRHDGDPSSPVGILVLASWFRDDAPWLYELIMEVYRAAKSEDADAIRLELGRLQQVSRFFRHGPFMEEMGMSPRDLDMFAMELPRVLERTLARALEDKKPAGPRKRHPRVSGDGA